MKKQVLCLATTAWQDHFTRKQQVMSRLTDCDIVYINPPVTKLARFKDPEAKEYVKTPPAKPMPNVRVYTPPAVWPFFNKYRGINRRNQAKILKPFITEKLADANLVNPVIWAYSPAYADLVDLIPHSALVYDCVDRHSAYKGFINPAVVDGMEKDLCGKCDAVFATAKGLYDTLSQYNKNAHFIPNGANYELFNKAYAANTECPDEMKDLKSPVCGFVGALQEWIDYDCLEEVAKKCGTLVFIGPYAPDIDLSRFDKYPNVKFLGPKPQTELPAYIARFDVCLNPFRSGKLSADVSPLKFYEYLATGKPIVSTRQPLQVADFADVVDIADTPEEFAELAITAPSRHDLKRQQSELVRARECSWDSRIAEMRGILAEKRILI